MAFRPARLTAYWTLLIILVLAAGGGLYSIFRAFAPASFQKSLISQQTDYGKQLEQRVKNFGVLQNSKGNETAAYVENWKRTIVHIPIPYVDSNLMTNIRGPYVNTNDLGYRGTIDFRDQIKLAKQIHRDGGRVAVLLGGSAAFGLYSDSDDTDITGYLNSIAQNDGQKIHFFNFGMGSYTSGPELAALVFYAGMLNPDVVIVFDGYNDVLKISSSVSAYHIGSGVPVVYNNNRPMFPVPFKSSYLDEKYDVDNLTQENLDDFYGAYERNLTMVAKVARSTGAAVIYATQPILGLSSEQRCDRDRNKEAVRRYEKRYPRIAKTAEKVAKTENAQYIDTRTLFVGRDCDQGYFADEVHLSSRGQLVVAESLYPLVLNALKPNTGKQ